MIIFTIHVCVVCAIRITKLMLDNIHVAIYYGHTNSLSLSLTHTHTHTHTACTVRLMAGLVGGWGIL